MCLLHEFISFKDNREAFTKINESPYYMLTNAQEPPLFMSSLVKIVGIFSHPIKLFKIVRPQDGVI